MRLSVFLGTRYELLIGIWGGAGGLEGDLGTQSSGLPWVSG